VDALNNPVQQAIVAAKPDANRLILAGPGSGKTPVVAHRCAYLLRVERVPAHGILVLCFNRHAAISLRRRVAELAGPDARGVTILTYHSLAMRLTGVSFAEQMDHRREGSPDFQALIKNAVALLRGNSDVPGAEPDALRDRLLDGYRHILVDEYQDIDSDQYDLVSAIAGRTQSDPDAKLSILAVGDDDQNIYSFRGANVEFIRRFQADYDAHNHFLVENYRSTAHIIAAANSLIAHNRDRMKTGHPIVPNKSRLGDDPGGRWQALDPFAAGRVQILEVADAHAQAAALIFELQRLKSLSPALEWRECAVLARTRTELLPIRAALESCGIPIHWAPDRDKLPALHHIREIARCLDVLTAHRQELMRAEDLIAELDALAAPTPGGRNPWQDLLRDVAEEWREDSGNAETPVSAALDFFHESLAQLRSDISFGSGIFLSTIHASKGLEFPHVFLPGGAWLCPAGAQDREEERRLCYVGMTRARETLALFQRADQPNPHTVALDGPFALRREPALAKGLPDEITALRYELLTLNDVFMDFAGQRLPTHPIHSHLGQLVPGSSLLPSLKHPHVDLVDASGFPVARLSAKACEAWRSRLDTIRAIRVVAMIRRHRDQTDPEFAKYSRSQSWEVPAVEIVWG
jgi:ATP-dependent DNA helicase RecQ